MSDIELVLTAGVGGFLLSYAGYGLHDVVPNLLFNWHCNTVRFVLGVLLVLMALTYCQ